MKEHRSAFEQELGESVDAEAERLAPLDDARKRFIDHLRSGHTGQATAPRVFLFLRGFRLVPWVTAAALCGAALLILAGPRGWLRGSAEDATAFSVAGQEGVLQQLLVAHDNSTLVTWPDGTHVDIFPKSAARIVESESNRVTVVLDRGTVEVAVAPDPERVWRLHAGPFEVQVVGTAFHVQWDEAARELTVRVRRGHVRVRGPNLGGGRDLRAGEVLKVASPSQVRGAGDASKTTEPTPATPTTEADRVDPHPAPGLAPPRTAPSVAAEPQETAAHQPPADTPAGSEGAWDTLAAEGRYREALGRANVSQLLATGDVGALTLLGDTARFAGETGVAARAYEALRERFPETSEAVRAAFELGRIAHRRGALDTAAVWFQRAIGEAPEGPLVAEARGRLLEITYRTGQTDAAKTLAEEYLRLHPAGAYAEFAKRLAGP